MEIPSNKRKQKKKDFCRVNEVDSFRSNNTERVKNREMCVNALTHQRTKKNNHLFFTSDFKRALVNSQMTHRS